MADLETQFHTPPPCPMCGAAMTSGALRTPGVFDSRVFLAPDLAEDYCLHLDVWLCPQCGHVELHADTDYEEQE